MYLFFSLQKLTASGFCDHLPTIKRPPASTCSKKVPSDSHGPAAQPYSTKSLLPSPTISEVLKRSALEHRTAPHHSRTAGNPQAPATSPLSTHSTTYFKAPLNTPVSIPAHSHCHYCHPSLGTSPPPFPFPIPTLHSQLKPITLLHPSNNKKDHSEPLLENDHHKPNPNRERKKKARHP